jgi:hypothetical protein
MTDRTPLEAFPASFQRSVDDLLQRFGTSLLSFASQAGGATPDDRAGQQQERQLRATQLVSKWKEGPLAKLEECRSANKLYQQALNKMELANEDFELTRTPEDAVRVEKALFDVVGTLKGLSESLDVATEAMKDPASVKRDRETGVKVALAGASGGFNQFQGVAQAKADLEALSAEVHETWTNTQPVRGQLLESRALAPPLPDSLRTEISKLPSGPDIPIPSSSDWLAATNERGKSRSDQLKSVDSKLKGFETASTESFERAKKAKSALKDALKPDAKAPAQRKLLETLDQLLSARTEHEAAFKGLDKALTAWLGKSKDNNPRRPAATDLGEKIRAFNAMDKSLDVVKEQMEPCRERLTKAEESHSKWYARQCLEKWNTLAEIRQSRAPVGRSADSQAEQASPQQRSAAEGAGHDRPIEPVVAPAPRQRVGRHREESGPSREGPSGIPKKKRSLFGLR